MRDIKIKEPVFRDKPLTDQELKERDLLYNIGPERFAEYKKKQEMKDKKEPVFATGSKIVPMSKKHSKFFLKIVFLIFVCIEILQSEIFLDIVHSLGIFLTNFSF